MKRSIASIFLLAGALFSAGCTSGAPLVEVVRPEFTTWAKERASSEAWASNNRLLLPVGTDESKIRIGGHGLATASGRSQEGGTYAISLEVHLESSSASLGVRALHYVVLEMPEKFRPPSGQTPATLFASAREVASGSLEPKGDRFEGSLSLSWAGEGVALWVSSMIEADPGVFVLLDPIAVR